MKKIQSIKGMHDLLPEDSAAWQIVEQKLKAQLTNYGYHELRTPIIEETELFKRSIGEVTDIVGKEMYTFADRNGESLTLRPEGTASAARAGIQHGLFYNQQQKLWYLGPMFRHERPQKGRYRQFSQLGVEAYGISGADVEAELLSFCHQLWRAFGIEAELTLEINSLGTADCRHRYREALVDYFSSHRERLDEDSLRRLEANPLRILDSKNPELRDLIDSSPELSDYLSAESAAHFERLQEYLRALGIEFRVNSRLVRGLDYYCHTVFEWVTDSLGAQGTVCAGGRYDGLIRQLGGQDVAGVGFAMGMERFIDVIRQISPATLQPRQPDVYIVAIGEQAELEALQLAAKMRDEPNGLAVLGNLGGGSIKSQFKRADRSQARYAVILADNELKQGLMSLKDLRNADTEQLLVDYNQLMQQLTN